MRVRPPLALAIGLSALLTTACQPWAARQEPQADEPAVETLYASQHCGRSQATPQASWIDNAQQLAASLQRIRPDTLGGKAMALPEPDFRQARVLLVEMGQRPTLGYALALDEKTTGLRISQGQAYLTLNWIRPPADVLVAQALSSPCLLLKIERGDYSAIRILDRQGDIKTGAE